MPTVAPYKSRARDPKITNPDTPITHLRAVGLCRIRQAPAQK
jgi:hypothetical protein